MVLRLTTTVSAPCCCGCLNLHLSACSSLSLDLVQGMSVFCLNWAQCRQTL